MEIIGKLETAEGDKLRVKRQPEDTRRKHIPRIPAKVEKFDGDEWHEIWTFDAETKESRERDTSYVSRKSDREIMEEAQEEAEWVLDREVFLSQYWAEKQIHKDLK